MSVVDSSLMLNIKSDISPMPLETNAYKLKSKNNNFADLSGSWHFRKDIKWKASVEKAKPYITESN